MNGQNTATIPGWDRLRHGGLLFDPSRLQHLCQFVPEPLDDYAEHQLRQRANGVANGSAEMSSFVSFVLERICGLGVHRNGRASGKSDGVPGRLGVGQQASPGRAADLVALDGETGSWLRGSDVPASQGRRAVTGESVKPRHLWRGPHDAELPVFLDDGKKLGIGRGRRIVSQVLGWLRATDRHLALITNGRQWRLLFAGLDYDAWCEWDVDLWFEEGELSAQVTALRTLLSPKIWTPPAKGDASPLLQAIRNTRKGQAELSEVLGERVREAVEILIRGHGDALSALPGDLAEYRSALTDDAGVSLAEVPDEEGSFSGPTPAEIYRAACRVAMRLVVILFAESRGLLPRENALYHSSYGLNGLLEQLERNAAQGRALRETFAAWPRVLALFELVRQGSHHPDLPVPRYGGELFSPGAKDGIGGLSKALGVFERGHFDTRFRLLPDSDVREMLSLLTRTTVRIRQGRGSVSAPVPVDFSDLSSEYLGILYEGLLDYELKTAPADEPVVFLAIGDQPALPLSRLERMDDGTLRTLFTNLKDTSTDDDGASEETTVGKAVAGTPEQPALDELDTPEAAEDRARYVVSSESSDQRQLHRARAENWARRAALAARLVKKPRGKDTPERQLAFRGRLGAKARQLVRRVVLPGEWYLVRWGGTRKGSGSFYTRPGLAIPTVQRTLRPLAYEPPEKRDGSPNLDAPAASWTPKPPEAILGLSVCDPACGSGSFPLAALRFLTDALFASLQHHRRIEQAGERSLVRLLGVEDDEHQPLTEELIPCPPDDEKFEPRLKAVLRRHVVERCIYAVDLDPLAVELCRLSLWIETMDRSLPFGFLDHKIKCGNSLIGAWFDVFRHYPVMAWKNREGGDKSHSNGVHFKKGERTKAIKDFTKDKLKLDLKLFLQSQDLFQDDLLEAAESVHADALSVLDNMHKMPIHDTGERERVYREELVGSDAWQSLKDAMDLWCACWFWPADELDNAPLPREFATPTAETRAVTRRIARDMRFFHWELEFPDVFRQAGSGFDAVLGNPPWDIAKPVSKEFFSNIDPLYRSYGKQEALQQQTQVYFSSRDVERDWLDYNARFRAQSNYMSFAASPFGDANENSASQRKFAIAHGGANLDLHDRWRHARTKGSGYVDPAHAFRHQGSADLNLYKLFLEAAHGLLRIGGRLGFLVPSGLYSDYGTGALRDLFLEHCRWEWLFGIENRDKVFPIDSRFKFNPVVIEKGGQTAAIRTAFMRRKLEDWERAEDHATPYTLAQIERFSPKSRAILEIQSARDLEILEKIYANGVLLGDDGPNGWGIKYAREFDMTNDSRLFPPRPQWEAKGYRPDEYSRWLLGDWRPIEELWAELGVDPSRPEPAEIELEDWLFDTTAGPERRQAEAQFVHGHLLKPGDVARTNWRVRCAQPPYDRLPVARAKIPAGVVLSREGDAWIREEAIEDTALPLMQGAMLNQFDFSQKGWVSGTGLQARWRPITWADKTVDPQFLMSTNDAGGDITALSKIAFRRVARTTDVRTMIASVVPRMPCGDKAAVLHPESPRDAAMLALVLNSFAIDAVARLRIGGTQVDYHYARELPLPIPNALRSFDYERIAFGLNCASQLTSPEWGKHDLYDVHRPWKASWAVTTSSRIRLRVLSDALVTHLLGLEVRDLHRILDSCDRVPARGDVKGFWRVDKDHKPELRQTVLTIIASQELNLTMLDADGHRKFRASRERSSEDEHWLLPETLRLVDYGLGQDDRALQPQPVASCLGPRFLDWQLAQSIEESWNECSLHSRNLLGIAGISDTRQAVPTEALSKQNASRPSNDRQVDLFD